jgi:hypothetical protein
VLLCGMAVAHPFPPAELERILAKLAKGDPMTQDEREIVRRRLDEVPSVEALDRFGKAFEASQRYAAEHGIALTDEEIQAEIDAARAERRGP